MEIENYALSSKIIYSVLSEKGVEFLHHANTVATSITFIEQKALLSRGYVEQNKLIQTEQKSDREDKKFDVWDHIFLDGEDLHSRYNQANRYGPVLFRFNLDLLNSPQIQHVFVTKSNPLYWKSSTPLNDKFYKDVNEIIFNYLTGKQNDSRTMFTLRNADTSLKLNKFLHSIVIDKPKLIVPAGKDKKILLGDYVENVITDTLKVNGLGHIPVHIRHDGNLTFCRCHAEYSYLVVTKSLDLIKKFSKKSGK